LFSGSSSLNPLLVLVSRLRLPVVTCGYFSLNEKRANHPIKKKTMVQSTVYLLAKKIRIIKQANEVKTITRISYDHDNRVESQNHIYELGFGNI